MEIQRVATPAPTTPVRATTSAAAPAAAADAPSAGQALAAANQLNSAPAAPSTKSALDIMPKSWVPMGHTDRNFKAKLGFVTVASGKADIDRSDDQASIKTSQGNFSFKTDPKHPDDIVASTPMGTYEGAGTLTDDTLHFKANDGHHGLTIKHSDDGSLRLDTKGFGTFDKGHLEVSGH
jgi:hypothetical protein